MILKRKIPRFQDDGKTAYADQCWGEMCTQFKGDERLQRLKGNISTLQKAGPTLDKTFDNYQAQGFTRELPSVLKGTGLNAGDFNNRFAYDYLGFEAAAGQPAVSSNSRITSWTKNPNFMKEYQQGFKSHLFKDLDPNATPEQRREYYNNMLTKYGSGERLGLTPDRKSIWGTPKDTENFSY